MQPNIYFPSSWWDLLLLIILLIILPIGIRNMLRSAKSKKRIPAKIIFVGLLILVGIWFGFAMLGYWLLIGIGAFVLIFLIKPWNWNWRFWKKSTSTSTTTTAPPSTPSSFSSKKFWSNSVNMAGGTFMWGVVIVIVLFVGLLLCEVIGLLMSKQVDKDERAVTGTEQILQHGDHHLIAGKKYRYYHTDAPEFFRPTNNGDGIHVILRSIANPSLYHEFTLVRNDSGGFSPGSWKTIHNTLDYKEHAYYTVEVVGKDTDITYSDHAEQ